MKPRVEKAFSWARWSFIDSQIFHLSDHSAFATHARHARVSVLHFWANFHFSADAIVHCLLVIQSVGLLAIV